LFVDNQSFAAVVGGDCRLSFPTCFLGRNRDGYDLAAIVYLVSFDMRQAVELEHPGFELGAFYIEEARFLDLD
jgi:hypothetical protein